MIKREQTSSKQVPLCPEYPLLYDQKDNSMNMCFFNIPMMAHADILLVIHFD